MFVLCFESSLAPPLLYFLRSFECKLPEIFRDIHEAHQKIDARLKAEQFKVVYVKLALWIPLFVGRVESCLVLVVNFPCLFHSIHSKKWWTVSGLGKTGLCIPTNTWSTSRTYFSASPTWRYVCTFCICFRGVVFFSWRCGSCLSLKIGSATNVTPEVL